MRIRTIRNQGNTLLVTLVTVGIIGLSVTAYLDVISNHNVSTMRSLQWNSAIPVAEAGIEEALTHLYYNPYSRDADGWDLVNGQFTKERLLSDRRYVTTISTDAIPVIVSKAYVLKPFSAEYIDPPRTVMAVTTNDPFFSKGMVAKGQIDIYGNNLTIDSFDSVDPNYSTNGRYDAAKRKDNGDVATNSSVVDSLSSGTAAIYGKASTGPGGAVSIGPTGSIGSKAWHDGGNTGIEPGWSSDDMNVAFPDVKPPFTSGGLTPVGGTVGGTNYAYILTSGNWELSSLSMGGDSKLLVMGNAVLYVKGNVSLSGQASIQVSTNGSLQLYVEGAQTALGGQGAMNAAGNATNLFYYGLPTNTQVTMSGNSAFTGAIYAPNAALTLGGGGTSTYDFVGAAVTGSVKMNGHYNFHFDENLRRQTWHGYTVIAWNEI